MTPAITRTDRKAARHEYRERPPMAGIYEVRAGGQVWLGASPTLNTVENRLRFTVQQGGHPNKALQAAAAGGFAFAVVEMLDPDTPALSRDRLIKERLVHWLAETGAHPL